MCEPVDKEYNVEWLKIGNVSFMTFVGLDVVAFGVGCYIILYNITTKEEIIYEANNDAKGEGVQCLVGYQQAYMFAFAEMAPIPRIFLVKHPEHEHICVLQERLTAHTYVAMAFAEMECLVCLTGIPSYEIIVWCWRTGEKLAAQSLNLICSNQQLRCSVSMPICVGFLAKWERETVFQLWQISICSKLCLLSKTEMVNGGLEPGAYVSAFSFAPDGMLLVTDTLGNLYLVNEETQSFVKVMSWPYVLREGGSIFPTNTLWWKGGVVMSGPNGFIQYIKRVSSTEFVPSWCITNEGPLLVMAVNRARDLLASFSDKGSLVQLVTIDNTVVVEKVKHYGAAVRQFCFVHPSDDYFVTVNVENALDVWEKKSGSLVASMEITKGFVLDMDCNPHIPYLALGRSDGVLQFIATGDKDVFQLAELQLCSEEITGIAFNSPGTLVVAASYKIGRIFVTQGLVGTGTKINVLDHYLSEVSIVNMHVMSLAKDDHKLLVLVNNGCVGSPSGNQLNVFTLPRLILESRLELPTHYSQCVYGHKSLLAIPYVSRHFQYVQLKSVENKNPDKTIECECEFEVTKTEPSGHKIRRFHIEICKNHILTFGWDGLIYVRRLESMKPYCTLETHHRFNSGVEFATIDSKSEFVLSLGKEGNLVCCKLLTDCGHKQFEHNVETIYQAHFQKRSIMPVSGTSPVKTWLETQRQEKLNIEAGIAAPEIKSILEDFAVLQSELVQLLDDNYKAPPEEQLDVLEFDLDTETREILLAEAETERDYTRRLLEAECLDCDRLAEVIKNNTWDTMEVKSRCIKAMLRDFSVDNYGLPPVPPEFHEELTWECESRKLTMEMSGADHFEPWFPIADEEGKKSEPVMSSSSLMEIPTGSVLEENQHLLSGSSSHQFVQVSPLHCSQFEMCCSFNNDSEIVMLEKVCMDLREYFNKLFDDMFLQKEREMGVLSERNGRLRTILSELKVTCSAPMDVEEPKDPEWSQEEKTERIVTIEDSEITEKPYISPSEQDLLNQKAAEEERIRQLLAADNFRELALIEMMDGMLEVRWEDELKKEIPKPKCMLEKDPEDYTETDLKAIKDYQEKCKTLVSERERYRKMLEIEYKKLENTIQESLNKFDSSLFELFQERLKVEAAMNHEQLKILRIHQLNDDRIRRELQEREITNKVLITDKESAQAHEQFSMMQEATNECRKNYEFLVAKDKAMGKRFKQEFGNTTATPAVLEQLLKYFRKRPKLQQRATQFPTLLLELARCVVENDKSSFMPPEFHDFLSSLDTLDLPTSATTNFDETVWATLVQVRRAKIEAELKVRACALELKEAEYTLSVVTKQMKAARERASANVAELKITKEEKIRLSRDLQIQLVMKQGLVETPLTGHISDFKHAVLINPKIVESINQNVLAAGSKKLDAMKQVTKLHRINKYKEWEYKKMKMECEDLEDKLNNIRNIKVTLEVKQYLKDRFKPKEKDIADEDAAFLRQAEDNYKNAVKCVTDEISVIESKIERFKQLNIETDRSILDLKCDVSEQQFERDLKLEDTVSESTRKRMSLIVRRSQLVAKIQEVHNDNLVLQTELELLRLRTYPTLKYKAPI